MVFFPTSLLQIKERSKTTKEQMTTPNNNPNFAQIKSLYEGRLNQFIDGNGQYAHLNLPKFYDIFRKSALRDIINDEKDDDAIVDVTYYQVPYNKENPVSPENRPAWKDIVAADRDGSLKFAKVNDNQPFGPSWTTTWFKVHLQFPTFAQPGETWVFEFDCENEGLVIDGETLLPVTAFSGKAERSEYLIKIPDFDSDSLMKKNYKHFFYIECANNEMFGCGFPGQIDPPDNNKYFHLKKSDLVLPNWEAKKLAYDFLQCQDAAKQLPDDSFEKHLCRRVCNEVMDLFDPNDQSSIAQCRKLIKDSLLGDVDDSTVYNKKNHSQEYVPIFGFGNCHIDTAWLWPFAETKRKIARSWTSQVAIIEQYPEYQFVASQAQQFKWLKLEHPEFFHEKLIPKIKEGSFVPIGGSWVENDTNMPSGEGLSRQFFFGQRFFMKNFNIKSKIYWLPDTFGYTSTLPQIIKLSQMDYFLTQKLSWNNINKFPYNTFEWQGIDGTQVLCHMPPADTYTSDASFADTMKSSKNNKSGDVIGGNLLLYGIGDGGGGPTTGMLEKLRRFRGLNNKLGSVIPKVSLGKLNGVEEFFANIESKNRGKTLPTWIGELYLEFHRGTYTTQAMLKKLMRLSEVQILELEKLCCWWSFENPDFNYPHAKINDFWEKVLLCQFHDVLPGSCIGMVYDHEAVPMLKKVVKDVGKLMTEVLQQANGTYKFNAKTLDFTKKCSTFAAEDDSNITLWNDDLKISIDKQKGVIVSIQDNQYEFLDLKTGRNTVGANQFVLFDDQPLNWQAWDTELYDVNNYHYINNVKSIDIIDDNSVKISFAIASEKDIDLFTTISLDSKMIKIKTAVNNWYTGNKFLKVEFPVNVHNDYCSYETQFGITKRPTHYNTSWDIAKFEVCHHKFADYSEYSKGVSIINDCKYGFATHGNLMRLSLLRSPKKPDANADMGNHEMEYAILPHKGGLNMQTVQKAIAFNNKNTFCLPPDLASRFEKFVTLSPLHGNPPPSSTEANDNLNIVISSVKRGEDDFPESEYSLPHFGDLDSSKTLVVRVYEPLGGEICAQLNVSQEFKKVDMVDNLEEPLQKDITTLDSHSIAVHLRPFQIKIFKFYF